MSSISSWSLLLFNGYLCCDIGSVLQVMWVGVVRGATKSIDLQFDSRNVVELHLAFAARFFALIILLIFIYQHLSVNSALVE